MSKQVEKLVEVAYKNSLSEDFNGALASVTTSQIFLENATESKNNVTSLGAELTEEERKIQIEEYKEREVVYTRSLHMANALNAVLSAQDVIGEDKEFLKLFAAAGSFQISSTLGEVAFARRAR
jgi:hypothetical protein